MTLRGVSDARRKFAETLREVETAGETVVLTRNGKPVAVLTPVPPGDVRAHETFVQAAEKDVQFKALLRHSTAQAAKGEYIDASGLDSLVEMLSTR